MDWGAIAGLVGGALTEKKAGELSAQQQRVLENVYKELHDIPLPELERIQAEQVGSQMGDVHSDPEQRQQQLDVMSQLQDIFSHGGFNIEDRAALNEALNRANVQGSAQRHALAGEFAQRGQLGAGARLALGNMDAQGAANRSNQSALDVAAQGEKRRMEALHNYADMASGLRSQDFGEASARATAKDAADRWNASAREKAGYYNAGLGQQQFGNQVTKATGQQGAANNLGAYYANEAQGVRNQGANLSAAAATALRSNGGGGSGGGGGGGGGNGSGPGYTSNPNNLTTLSDNPYDQSSNPDEWDNPYGGY